jgi:hypothetical protein
MGVMGESIQQRGGQFLIAEDLRPVAKPQIGGHNHGYAFIEP